MLRGAPKVSPGRLRGMRVGDRAFAYGLLRVAFGVNFAGHGLVRIYHGVGQFAGTTAGHLAGAPLPHGMVDGFALMIPWIEALLGVALILGVLTRMALIGGAVFMMALTVGVAANQQWDVAGQQLVYSVVFFVLLFLVEHNSISMDGLMMRRRGL
jgi:thiosulfate dehydrogenase [quinone] large subunit